MEKLYKPKTRKELNTLIREHFEKGRTNLNDIDTTLITDMSWLFIGIQYNFDVSEWNTKNVENMHGMFINSPRFNCDISRWDVSGARNMACMFQGCHRFNQDISRWDISRVENMEEMFLDCPSFNQDLSRWDVRSIIYTEYMFLMCQIKEEWKPKYLELYGKTI